MYLRYRAHGSLQYYPWNMKEKVTLIDDYQSKYVVIGLRSVDDAGIPGSHFHSLVIDVDEYHANFDLDNLMTFLQGSEMDSLNEEFIKCKYVPWVNSTAKSNASKLRLIWITLDHYAVANAVPVPAVGGNPSKQARRATIGGLPPQSGNTGEGSRGTRPGMARSEPQLRDPPSSQPAESTRKRRKPNQPGGTAGAGSSGSALTSVEATPSTSDTPPPIHEKFTKIQSDFWADHKSCFILDDEIRKVHIKQCIIAKDQYVIRTLQKDIVESVKNELLQIGDMKQRQRICVTPVDMKNELLKKKPESWDEIRKGKFMIINGQHSITASKELQTEGCGEARRVELQEWEAIIVWTTDPHKLRSISKFYNLTNHLDHAQPTWGNQIISCRNIWFTHKRATDVPTEAASRHNKAVYNLEEYKVWRTLIFISSTRR